MIYSSEDRVFVEKEFTRMGFDKDARWRISDINKDYELCNTYPRFLIIPSSFKDEDLESVAKFRYFRRIPTAVWRHIKNGCFIVRSSQPTVGWFGWFRDVLDENLIQSYVNNTMPPISGRVDDIDDEGGRSNQEESNHSSAKSCEPNKSAANTGTPDDTDNRRHEQVNSSETPASSFRNPVAQKLNHNNHNNNIRDVANLESENGTNNVDTPNPELRDELGIERTTQELASSLSINGNGAVHSESSTPTAQNGNGTITETASKMLIIDARSHTAAMANWAKGGGCECSEYYQRCEVQYKNLANIHSIRKSFQAIRSVCESYSEQSNNWVSFLDNSRWLHHISGLLESALLVVNTIDIEERSILIHCSDGWDRTPQLVALAEVMLDPYYRTFDGFRVLIQREWLDFGHKFADRCGSNPSNEDPNERCPIFLQWLDCVQQLMVQFPRHFEFNSYYLDKLNRHTYSDVFGTFSFNSTQERTLRKVGERNFCLWSYIDASRRQFRNEKYVEKGDILRPSFKVRDLNFWKEVYLPPPSNEAPFKPKVNDIDTKKFYDSLCLDDPTPKTHCL